jgi:hypothetical protein
MHRKRLLWSMVTAIVIILVAIAIRLYHESDTPQAAPPGNPPPPPATTPSCSTAKTTDRTGQPIPESMLAQVTAVHDAACRRDYDSLLQLMDDPFSTGKPSNALDALRVNYGAPLTIIAQTLETPAISDQGGLVYCHPNGAVVVFARGTLSHPGKWTAFALTGDGAIARECENAAR